MMSLGAPTVASATRNSIAESMVTPVLRGGRRFDSMTGGDGGSADVDRFSFDSRQSSVLDFGDDRDGVATASSPTPLPYGAASSVSAATASTRARDGTPTGWERGASPEPTARASLSMPLSPRGPVGSAVATVPVQAVRRAPVLMGGFDHTQRSRWRQFHPSESVFHETFSCPPHVSYPIGAVQYYCPRLEFDNVLRLVTAATTAVANGSSPGPMAPPPVVRLAVTSDVSMHRTLAALVLLHQTHLPLMQSEPRRGRCFDVCSCLVVVGWYRAMSARACVCVCSEWTGCVLQVWIFECSLYPRRGAAWARI
jgi:hypothetical protein